jgi:ABC-type glutathione transport system ATPase component
MIFITHNLALVRNVAQTAVVLRHGQIVEAGPAGQILAEPVSGYTAQLLADAPRLSRPRAEGGAPPTGLRSEGARNERVSDEGSSAGIAPPEAQRKH